LQDPIQLLGTCIFVFSYTSFFAAVVTTEEDNEKDLSNDDLSLVYLNEDSIQGIFTVCKHPVGACKLKYIRLCCLQNKIRRSTIYQIALMYCVVLPFGKSFYGPIWTFQLFETMV